VRPARHRTGRDHHAMQGDVRGMRSSKVAYMVCLAEQRLCADTRPCPERWCGAQHM
jgi:hypothetical protein